MSDRPLSWVETDVAAVDDHPTAVDDILVRHLDGLTVAGVLTDAEVDAALPLLEPPDHERVPAMFGWMLGLPLAEVEVVHGDPDPRAHYLEVAARAAVRHRAAFGFDLGERVTGVLSRLADGRPTRAPTEDGRPYATGNVRWYRPGGSGLPAHVGNEFDMHDDPALAHLRRTTRTRDHLSWFVVLQAPESGGALSVYDAVFEDHRPGEARWSERGRADDDFEDVPARRIAPPAGTLVVFGGGWRWHRVDPVAGSVPRVTFGGFAGTSHDGATLHPWF